MNRSVAFSVRRVSIEDTLSLLTEMQKQVFGDTYKGAALLPLPSWWIAYAPEPVGFCGLRLYEDGSSAFLCLSGVVPDYRGNGLQRRFIRVREREARKRGYKRMISYTSIDNVWSANNLIRCGYELYVPRWEWGTRPAYYFRKFL